MKKASLIFSGLMLASGLAFAQSAQDQMSAFKNAYKENQAVEDVKAQAQAKARAQADAEAKVERKKQEDRAERERARNQAYDDEMRRMDLQERKAGVAARRAQSSRSNDYIDQDLKRQGAQTDVIQSQADSNRNLSVGARDMMQGVGQGASKGLPPPPSQSNTLIVK